MLWALKSTFDTFPNKAWFIHVCSMSLLKTLWKKENLLVKPFSFFPVFSTHLENFLTIFTKFEIVVCLEESKICHLGKG